MKPSRNPGSTRDGTAGAQRVAQAAYELHGALERELRGTLVELDLTFPLADALWQLDPARGPASRRELAERLRCDPSNVTFLVDRLEDRRLVSRGHSARDRRIVALSLTPAGRHARDRLIATLARSAMFSRLSGAQRRQLAELLGLCLDQARSPMRSAR
ncbi:MAG: MarR family transcriptional regulator [Solirubrobacterales bacterium]|nr:MarR family transcriptional regulator [Solirubrobacterales bacterium]